MENTFVDPEDLSNKIRSKKDLYDLFKYRSKSVPSFGRAQSGLLNINLAILVVTIDFSKNLSSFEILLNS